MTDRLPTVDLTEALVAISIITYEFSEKAMKTIHILAFRPEHTDRELQEKLFLFLCIYLSTQLNHHKLHAAAGRHYTNSLSSNYFFATCSSERINRQRGSDSIIMKVPYIDFMKEWIMLPVWKSTKNHYDRHLNVSQMCD
jgi:hypothetical protein